MAAKMVIIRRSAALVVTAACLTLACAGTTELPDDPTLKAYIEISARCAYVDRAFSNDPDLFSEEIRQINLPPSWKAISDSLVAAHGSDPRFWYQVYSRIMEKSRR